MMHKTSQREDFPVSMLVSRRYKPLVNAYYQAARFADDIADNPMLSSAQKLEKLAAVREAFMQPDKSGDLQLIRGLGRLFVAERLDASLFLDLLEAFERDAAGKPIRIWEELIEYCRFSAAPVGRFMLAIHDESPNTYLPAENLCAVLQLLNHMSGIKEDLSLLRRCYIPQSMMDEYDVRASDLGLQTTLPEVRRLLVSLMLKIEKMQPDAEILPHLVKNFRLRVNVCVILSLINSMIQKYKNTDILQAGIHPKAGDWTKALFKGFFQALFCGWTRRERVL